MEEFLEQAEFDRRAGAMLEAIAEAAEAQDGALDVEFDSGILNIETADGGQFVINKHAPNRQIWLSSPKSGAWHFSWDEASGQWVSTRDAALLLRQILEKDLGITL